MQRKPERRLELIVRRQRSARFDVPPARSSHALLLLPGAPDPHFSPFVLRAVGGDGTQARLLLQQARGGGGQADASREPGLLRERVRQELRSAAAARGRPTLVRFVNGSWSCNLYIHEAL